MQVCTSLQTDNHARTPPLILQAGCPSCCPTNSVKAVKANCTTCKTQVIQATIKKPQNNIQRFSEGYLI